jgi:membrane protein YdbS with pleckstrin-like domain
MAEEEEKKPLYLPKGFQKYQPEDFTLIEGEELKKIVSPLQFNFLRGYLIGALLVAFGFSLIPLYNLTSIGVGDLMVPVSILVALYFVYFMKATESAKAFGLSLAKYAVGLVVLSYLITVALRYVGPLLERVFVLLGVAAPSIPLSLNPLDVMMGVLRYAATTVNALFILYRDYLIWVPLGMVGLGLLLFILTFFYARGHLYYITNKRVIVRKKFLSHQVTTLPMDKIVEVVAFKGPFARLFKMGDVSVTLTSGGGLKETMAPEPVGVTKPFYKIEKLMRGVKEPFKIRDLILQLREAYIEALYLSRMEKELKRIREGVEKMAKKEKEKVEKVVPVYPKKKEEAKD